MNNGGARHQFYLNATEVTLILKYAILGNPFSIMASAFGKASVAVLMLRILQKSVYWQKWFIYTNLALYMAITVVYIILAFVQCSALSQKITGTGCREPHILSDIALLQSCKSATLLDRNLVDEEYSIRHLHGFCLSLDSNYRPLETKHAPEA